MSWIRRFGGRLPDFEAVVRRFPIPLAIMAAFTVWIIANNHSDIWSNRDAEYIASGFILAGYVAVIVKLIAERRELSRLIGGLVGIGLALIAFLLSYFARELDFTTVMAIGAAIVFLGNAAAWRVGRQDRNVWNFTQKLWTGALFATVGSVIFALGMVSISEAVKALFGVDIDKLTYETILPIGLAFLAPLYWLGTLPNYGEAEDVTELSFEARALSFMGTWMLAPLVIIYALIVLAYGAKVLIQRDLPKGEIAQLVSPFIGVGMLVWLMLEPKVLKESGFVRFYRAAWHWIMLPAAVLLGVAIFVRIREYGYTPTRFFLSLVVTWAFIQSLWFIAMPKAKRDIRFPTGLAAGLLLMGAFVSLPISSINQFQRAEAVKQALPSLSAADFAKNPAQAKQFLGSLRYLIQQKDETRFKRLLPDYDFPETTYGDNYNQLIEGLGLDDIEVESSAPWSNYSVTSDLPIQVNEDSQIFFISNLNIYPGNRSGRSAEIVKSQDGSNVELLIEGQSYTFDIRDIVSNVEFVGRNDDAVPTFIPVTKITSESGETAELIFVSGRLNFNDEILEGGTVTLAVIIPN
jgi:hypothetical protein